MNGPAWAPQETSDAASLSWADFHPKYPTRSYDAWRLKRSALRRKVDSSQTATKVQPVVEDAPQDDEELRSLLAKSDEELFDHLIAWQDALNAAFPQQQDVRVSIPTDQPIGLVLMSDWHIGGKGTDLRQIREDVRIIASHPRLYVGLGGDVIDNFILEKMAAAQRSSSATVEVQWRGFRHVTRPLLDTHSLLWVSSGNHDQWTERVAGIDGILSALASVPCCYIGKSYTQEGGYVDLTVGNETYTIWRKHRPSGMVSRFNINHFAKQMQRVELPREFDIAVTEHIHSPETTIWHYRRKKRVVACLGSYKVDDPHARNWGFYNGGYGVAVVVLYPHTRRMVPFDNLHDALAYLDGDAVPMLSRDEPA